MTAKVIVYHGGYGCDTGCCGHWVFVTESDLSGEKLLNVAAYKDRKHTFDHPYRTGELWRKDAIDYARDAVRDELGEEHVADLDWDKCLVVFEEDCGR